MEGTKGARTELLLRAELHHPAGKIVSHTLHVSKRSVSVATGELLPPGTPVRLVLSFPGLVHPFEVEARVLMSRGDRGPAQPACVICDISNASRAAQEILGEVLALKHTPPGFPAQSAPSKAPTDAENLTD